MKSKRLIISLGVLAAVLAFLFRQVRSATATGLDQSQKGRLLGAIQTAHDSAIAALDPATADERESEARDQKAAKDAEALGRTFEEFQPLLRPHLGSLVASFVETITGSQLQIMTFAINRKNRGTPDAAQIEAENGERAKFRENADPLLSSLVRAFS